MTRFSTLLSGTLLLGGLLISQLRAQDDTSNPPPPPTPPEGEVVMARGPVHEAYAEPIELRPQATPLVEKQPPDPVDEVPPDQKPEGDNVQWIPGYWSCKQ
jgi:hypothetical protein